MKRCKHANPSDWGRGVGYASGPMLPAGPTSPMGPVGGMGSGEQRLLHYFRTLRPPTGVSLKIFNAENWVCMQTSPGHVFHPHTG
mmetsp:Transcript_23361/g.42135  ORF Transcript_23361/g.42135 Transcript_23361/m.42135 type:complete len:85 (-) Transcript_23361:194-448(-)